MIARVVTYGARSLEGFQEWVEERSPAVENILGLRRVEFVRQDHPPRAGAIMYFDSAQDLKQYEDSHRYEQLRESVREGWGDASQPVHESVYRIVAGEGWAREKT